MDKIPPHKLNALSWKRTNRNQKAPINNIFLGHYFQTTVYIILYINV